ncbi:hypothetical protein [Halospeciosus flavus]|uniref:Uncharacterized protein n=1 Tax=Halospeciosus flavus TaxID=3032283 RepID=A0ABD5Z813_9EURY|nr:hypothetical protein [Halospeciosus flavus]
MPARERSDRAQQKVLEERDAEKGLATLCVGFGQGGAITFERK